MNGLKLTCHLHSRQADWSSLHPRSEPYWLSDLQVGQCACVVVFSPYSVSSVLYLTLNRRYLIDVDGMDPKKAVECECCFSLFVFYTFVYTVTIQINPNGHLSSVFNSSRGHCIERKNYLDDLQHGRKRRFVQLCIFQS